MSFSILLLLVLIQACGLKSDPLPPKDSPSASYLDQFGEKKKEKKDK